MPVPVPLVKCVSDFDCCFGAKCNLQTTKCCLANGQACVKQVNLTQPVTPGELCCSGQCDSASNTCSNVSVCGAARGREARWWSVSQEAIPHPGQLSGLGAAECAAPFP